MEFNIKKSGNINIVNFLEDRYTYNNTLKFRETMEELIEKGERYFVLNLTNLRYMDSAGLGSIVTIHNMLENKKKLHNQKGDMVVAGITKNVDTIFSIFKMKTVIDIYDDEESAVDALKG